VNDLSHTLPAAPTGEALVAYLRDCGVDAELLAPGVPMPTVPLAAAAIGVTEDQIIKSLLFRDSHGNLVLAIASGAARIDRGLLAAATGLDRPKLADPATVLAATGFPAGGVSPVAHATPVRVVIDRRAAALKVVYGGGGAEDVLLKISPRDIIRLTDAEIVDITSEN
jgi:Cys-tRNA(Pro) deacylase